MFQKFIYELNQPYLRVKESAFTTINIVDRNYLIELFGNKEYPDGSFVIDYIDEIMEFQKAFMRVVSEVRKTMMMTFPVLTFSLLYKDGKFVDEDFARWANKHNMEWYDSNFFISEDAAVLSSCCHLFNDTSKLDAFINSIGGTALSIGSVKVNTINLRRIALLANGDRELYMELLKERVDLCMKVLATVRHIIQRNVEKGILTNYQKGLIDIEKQYCTIGITAMYETLDEFGLIDTDELGNKSYSEEGLEFAKKIMNLINKMKDNSGYDFTFNVECIPAENANVKLSYKDQLLFPYATCYPVYSNQWIPLIEKCTIQEKVRLSSLLDKECGGGVISHVGVNGRFASEEQAWNMLNYLASHNNIYTTFNTKINVCKHGHGSIGTKVCDQCGEPIVDSFQRVNDCPLI